MTPNVLLASLLRAAKRGQLMVWSVQHAQGGDPVPAAWAACTDDRLMFQLVQLVGTPRGVYGRPWALCEKGCVFRRSRSQEPCERCAEAIRRVVPTLTMGELARRAA